MKKLITILLFFILNISWGQVIWQRVDEMGLPDCDGSTIPAKGRHDLLPQPPFTTVQELVDNNGILERPQGGGYVEFTGWWFSDNEYGYYYLNLGGGLWSPREDCGIPLPIDLVSFNSEVSLDGVVLKWVVASQVNNDRFEIQKSLDLVNWEIIKTVTGAGNSNTQMSYSILDQNPSKGYSYYRLNQVDHDGVNEIFSPIAVYVKEDRKQVIKEIDVFGKEINSNQPGIVIQIWNNGETTKTIK